MEDTMPYNRLNDMWKGKEQKEGTLIMHLVRSKKNKKNHKQKLT